MSEGIVCGVTQDPIVSDDDLDLLSGDASPILSKMRPSSGPVEVVRYEPKRRIDGARMLKRLEKSGQVVKSHKRTKKKRASEEVICLIESDEEDTRPCSSPELDFTMNGIVQDGNESSGQDEDSGVDIVKVKSKEDQGCGVDIVKVKPSSWSCTQCTILNSGGDTCEICGLKRPVRKAGEWACTSCTLQNQATEKKCKACGKERLTGSDVRSFFKVRSKVTKGTTSSFLACANPIKPSLGTVSTRTAALVKPLAPMSPLSKHKNRLGKAPASVNSTPVVISLTETPKKVKSVASTSPKNFVESPRSQIKRSKVSRSASPKITASPPKYTSQGMGDPDLETFVPRNNGTKAVLDSDSDSDVYEQKNPASETRMSKGVPVETTKQAPSHETSVVNDSQSSSSSQETNGVIEDPPTETTLRLEDVCNMNQTATKSILWINKYAPETFEDLCKCLHKPKVTEVQDWLDGVRNGTNGKRLLLLHGPVGCGKSTCVRVLAKQLNFVVREWCSETDRATTSNFHSRDVGFSKDSDFSVQYVSQLDDFAQFVRSARYPTLLDSGISILLIDAIPTLGTPEKRQRFQEIIGGLLSLKGHTRYRFVTVIVYTCKGESTNPSDLNKLFSEHVITNPQTSLINFAKVPPTRMSRVLNCIVEDEKLDIPDDQIIAELVTRADGDIRNAIQNLEFFGIGSNRLQGQNKRNPKKKAKTKTKKKIKPRMVDPKTKDGERDVLYSVNYVVGKLIRAKTIGEENDDSSPVPEFPNRLTYNPETLGHACAFGPDALNSFIQYHCVAQYKHLDELCEALDVFCLADMLHNHGAKSGHGAWKHDSSGNRVFPTEYVVSLAARAVPGTRTVRESVGFQPITKPAIYALNDKRSLTRVSYREQLLHSTNPNLSKSVLSDIIAYGEHLPKRSSKAVDQTQETLDRDPLDDDDIEEN
mmetsp:Transcript_7930/g.14537  ORF Transcript_7930/g.14537 Transcript_7930/m.14537 type:complete len:932 (-) Transcript_7930:2273-5068(-)